MMNRRPPTKSSKKQVFARDHYTCRYCGRIFPEDILHLDHIVPRALGGSDELDNLATACPTCNIRKGAKELSQYLAETVTQNREFHKSFLQSLEEIKALTQTTLANESLKRSLNKLLFANVIAAMETYLSDAFINTVVEDGYLIRKLVESSPDFKNRKFELTEIYGRMEGLRDEIKKYLLDIIYHNISKVKPMYECVLNVSFPDDLDSIFKSIQTRHDIVHRNGKSKEGNPVKIGDADVLSLITEVESFIEGINKQLPARR